MNLPLLRAVLLSSFLALPAAAAGTRSIGTATIPLRPALGASIAQDFAAFFAAKRPDPASMAGVLRVLSRVDMLDLDNRANLAPLLAELSVAGGMIYAVSMEYDRLAETAGRRAADDWLRAQPAADPAKLAVMRQYFGQHLDIAIYGRLVSLESAHRLGAWRGRSGLVERRMQDIAVALAARSPLEPSALGAAAPAAGRGRGAPVWRLARYQQAAAKLNVNREGFPSVGPDTLDFRAFMARMSMRHHVSPTPIGDAAAAGFAATVAGAVAFFVSLLGLEPAGAAAVAAGVVVAVYSGMMHAFREGSLRSLAANAVADDAAARLEIPVNVDEIPVTDAQIKEAAALYDWSGRPRRAALVD